MIWLLRHGEAEDGSPDAERALTEKGERQSKAAGRALKKLGIAPAACLASPKVRAADTAKLACEELGIDFHLEPKLAGGPFDAEELAAGLGDDVLLVGHDPHFSMAVHTPTRAQVRMTKAGPPGIARGRLEASPRPPELEAPAA